MFAEKIRNDFKLLAYFFPPTIFSSHLYLSVMWTSPTFQVSSCLGLQRHLQSTLSCAGGLVAEAAILRLHDLLSILNIVVDCMTTF